MKSQTVSADEAARAWDACGFDCEVRTDPPGGTTNDLCDKDEVVVVIDGDLEVAMGNETVHPRAGDGLVIPAGRAHCVRNVGNRPSVWLHGVERELPETD